MEEDLDIQRIVEKFIAETTDRSEGYRKLAEYTKGMAQGAREVYERIRAEAERIQSGEPQTQLKPTNPAAIIDNRGAAGGAGVVTGQADNNTASAAENNRRTRGPAVQVAPVAREAPRRQRRTPEG